MEDGEWLSLISFQTPNCRMECCLPSSRCRPGYVLLKQAAIRCDEKEIKTTDPALRSLSEHSASRCPPLPAPAGHHVTHVAGPVYLEQERRAQGFR